MKKISLLALLLSLLIGGLYVFSGTEAALVGAAVVLFIWGLKRLFPAMLKSWPRRFVTVALVGAWIFGGSIYGPPDVVVHDIGGSYDRTNGAMEYRKPGWDVFAPLPIESLSRPIAINEAGERIPLEETGMQKMPFYVPGPVLANYYWVGVPLVAFALFVLMQLLSGLRVFAVVGWLLLLPLRSLVNFIILPFGRRSRIQEAMARARDEFSVSAYDKVIDEGNKQWIKSSDHIEKARQGRRAVLNKYITEYRFYSRFLAKLADAKLQKHLRADDPAEKAHTAFVCHKLAQAFEQSLISMRDREDRVLRLPVYFDDKLYYQVSSDIFSPEGSDPAKSLRTDVTFEELWDESDKSDLRRIQEALGEGYDWHDLLDKKDVKELENPQVTVGEFKHKEEELRNKAAHRLKACLLEIGDSAQKVNTKMLEAAVKGRVARIWARTLFRDGGFYKRMNSRMAKGSKEQLREVINCLFAAEGGGLFTQVGEVEGGPSIVNARWLVPVPSFVNYMYWSQRKDQPVKKGSATVVPYLMLEAPLEPGSEKSSVFMLVPLGISARDGEDAVKQAFTIAITNSALCIFPAMESALLTESPNMSNPSQNRTFVCPEAAEFMKGFVNEIKNDDTLEISHSDLLQELTRSGDPVQVLLQHIQNVATDNFRQVSKRLNNETKNDKDSAVGELF
ncbi:hypothetical protein [Halorhodospira halochloris]|nr:hypothetical protein [Halorhodospira halochloris]MBK1651723.1 hypothetical protein [Halorhodospira halochloris]